MAFQPSPDRLLPELPPRHELVVLARALGRAGYDEDSAGDLTYRLGDGTLLCNPWGLSWDEFGPGDVVRVDPDGRVVEGRWPAPRGLAVLLSLHHHRPDVQVAVHARPRFGAVWAGAGRLPACFDADTAIGSRLVFVDHAEGPLDSPLAAEPVVLALGDENVALIANHGVLVGGDAVAVAYQRAVTLEHRCRHAWHVEALWGGKELTAERPPPDEGRWEAAARRELRADPGLHGNG
jgi:L-ribulose-5-phosphate 4-epimerase